RLFGRASARRAGNARRPVLLGVERLQDRLVPSHSPVSLHGHTLVIQGSSGADRVSVSQAHGKLTVVDNHHASRFSAAKVTSIVFTNRGGNDPFVNHPSIHAVSKGVHGPSPAPASTPSQSPAVSQSVGSTPPVTEPEGPS